MDSGGIRGSQPADADTRRIQIHRGLVSDGSTALRMESSKVVDKQGNNWLTHKGCLRAAHFCIYGGFTMYNRTYIAEKLDTAIKSLTFVRENIKDAPEWMHCTDDDPVKVEIPYALKQLQIITDHMEARDRAAEKEV